MVCEGRSNEAISKKCYPCIVKIIKYHTSSLDDCSQSQIEEILGVFRKINFDGNSIILGKGCSYG